MSKGSWNLDQPLTERFRNDDVLVLASSGKSRDNIYRLIAVLLGLGLFAGVFAWILHFPWGFLPLAFMVLVLWGCVRSFGTEVVLELNKTANSVRCEQRVFGKTKKRWSGTMEDIEGVELREYTTSSGDAGE